MSAVNHVFEKKMKPLLLEKRKKGQGHGNNKETFKVAKTMMQYIQCIQSPEWAAATAHKITQELPPGLTLKKRKVCHNTSLHSTLVWALSCFLFSTGYEKTQSLRFCLALGDAWLKDPNIEVCASVFTYTYVLLRLKRC